ncbi:DUF4297 family anti-phage-associated protein [Flavobacterium restrictum]|uniref:DUF4297 domain-containing protein n=1 Tax=Flavobacterium restrictum TaxID=2594428 RepID=A0A553EDH2_9FLAO|nr:DUF4297 family anti-phage-associated protein [Flavobacterium restrictum]TRX43069.1 hypothetical protein FNW21_01670 [Flavobacterium restrictum]
MTDRTATDTIKGYFYQFDLAILKLLQLDDDSHEITVEGIEDVDVKNATEEIAIQCKYHAKTEYNHSAIAKPIRLMLNHFKQVLIGKKKRIKYLYFGHFKSGHERFPSSITLDFLKSSLLTYKKDRIEYKHYEDLKVSDTELMSFLETLEIEINAKSYEEQLKEIFTSLKNQNNFNCDDFEAENFYYNNALKIISNLAKENDLANRRITKKDFLTQINSKQVLFHKWFVQFKGKKKLLSDVRAKYFCDYNNSPFERFFLIEVNSSNYLRSDLKSIIHLISKKYSQLSRLNPDSFCPYIHIFGLSNSELIELKTELISENFKFKDGFDFNGSSFNPKSIAEKATHYNGIKIKIVSDLKDIEPVFNQISKTKEVYHFYFETPFFSTSNASIKHIQIQIQEINDIKNII